MFSAIRPPRAPEERDGPLGDGAPHGRGTRCRRGGPARRSHPLLGAPGGCSRPRQPRLDRDAADAAGYRARGGGRTFSRDGSPVLGEEVAPGVTDGERVRPVRLVHLLDEPGVHPERVGMRPVRGQVDSVAPVLPRHRAHVTGGGLAAPCPAQFGPAHRVPGKTTVMLLGPPRRAPGPSRLACGGGAVSDAHARQRVARTDRERPRRPPRGRRSLGPPRRPRRSGRGRGGDRSRRAPARPLRPSGREPRPDRRRLPVLRRAARAGALEPGEARTGPRQPRRHDRPPRPCHRRRGHASRGLRLRLCRRLLRQSRRRSARRVEPAGLRVPRRALRCLGGRDRARPERGRPRRYRSAPGSCSRPPAR